MSYSFEFEIVRYLSQDKTSLLTSKQLSQKLNECNPQDREKIEESYQEEYITLNVKGSGHYTPSRTHGDPNDCYPEEFDCELDSAEDSNQYDWLDDLTDSEYKEMLSELADKIYRGDRDCPNDYEPYNKYDSFDRWGY